MSELQNDLNPEVELEIEAEAESTIELEMEVDMGSTASEYAAEAWAVGKRHGVDVPSTDQTYHNNSKYYAEQAAQASTGGLIAPTYSASDTYAVGDHVIYGGNYYECTTAITTAEEWTAAHWTQRIVGEEITDIKEDVTDLKSAILLQEETIPDTTQTISFDSSGNVSSIVHKDGSNNTIRSDAFTFGTNTITEVRTLYTGETLTIVTNTTTLVTTVTYAAA